MVVECWPALALAEAPVFPTLSVPLGSSSLLFVPAHGSMMPRYEPFR